MKFLADMGVSQSTVAALRSGGHDVIPLRERGLSRLPDESILELARAEQRIVPTFDLDFGDLLAAASQTLTSVVIFRLRNDNPPKVTARLLGAIQTERKALEAGAVAIIEESRTRIRLLPIDSTSPQP